MKFKTPEQKKKFLKDLKIAFLIPSGCIVLAVIFSYVLNLLMIGGILFLLGFLFLEIFMIYFWILNLVMMWRFKKRVLFSFAIIFPFLSLIFYIYHFYPFLKEDISDTE